MRSIVPVILAVSLVAGTVSQSEAATLDDALCVWLVAKNIHQQAGRAALATFTDPTQPTTYKDWERAVPIYREKLESMVAKSPLRHLRDPFLTLEEIDQRLGLAARECPKWARQAAKDPLIRNKIVTDLAKFVARRQPLLFATAIADGFDPGIGGGRRGDKDRLGPGHILDFDAKERLLLGAWGAAFALNAAAIGVAVQLGLLTPAQGAQLVQAISAAGAAAMGAIAAGSALLDGVRDREGGEGR